MCLSYGLRIYYILTLATLRPFLCLSVLPHSAVTFKGVSFKLGWTLEVIWVTAYSFSMRNQSSSEFSHVWVELGHCLPIGARHSLGLITALSAGILLNSICSFNWISFVHAEGAFGKCTYCHIFIFYQEILVNFILIPEDDASINQSFLFA